MTKPKEQLDNRNESIEAITYEVEKVWLMLFQIIENNAFRRILHLDFCFIYYLVISVTNFSKLSDLNNDLLLLLQSLLGWLIRQLIWYRDRFGRSVGGQPVGWLRAGQFKMVSTNMTKLFCEASPGWFPGGGKVWREKADVFKVSWNSLRTLYVISTLLVK